MVISGKNFESSSQKFVHNHPYCHESSSSSSSSLNFEESIDLNSIPKPNNNNNNNESNRPINKNDRKIFVSTSSTLKVLFDKTCSDKENYRVSCFFWLAIASTQMASLSLGMNSGWVSPALGQMTPKTVYRNLTTTVNNFLSSSSSRRRNEWRSPVVADYRQKALIASAIEIGAMLSSLTVYHIVDYFGRRKLLLFVSIPWALSWAFIAISKSPVQIIFSRFIAGLSTGITSSVLPIYLADISSPSLRGLVGMLNNFSMIIGLISMPAITVFFGFHWPQTAWIAALPPFLMFISMISIPDSPLWLIINKPDEHEARLHALESLRMLRSEQSNIVAELNDYFDLKQQYIKLKWSWKTLSQPNIYKPLLIGISLLLFQDFCGALSLQVYMDDIFIKSHSILEPTESTLICQCVMFFTTMLGAITIDRYGRKLLMTISALGMMISMMVLGAHFFSYNDFNRNINAKTSINSEPFSDDRTDGQMASSLPLLCIATFGGFYALGLGPCKWIILTEISPPDSIRLISPIISTLGWGFGGVVVYFTKHLFNKLSYYATFWLFSFVCFLVALFTVLVLIETRRKTMAEIIKEMNY